MVTVGESEGSVRAPRGSSPRFGRIVPPGAPLNLVPERLARPGAGPFGGRRPAERRARIAAGPSRPPPLPRAPATVGAATAGSLPRSCVVAGSATPGRPSPAGPAGRPCAGKAGVLAWGRGARLARGERQKPLPTHPAGPDLPGGSALDVPCPPPCRPVEREQGDEGSRTTAPRARTATTSRPRPRTRRFCWSATWTPRQHVRRRPARSGPPSVSAEAGGGYEVGRREHHRGRRGPASA